MWETLLLTFLVILICVKYLKKNSIKNLPPGPTSYPLIGSPVIGKYGTPFEAFHELHKQYGPIFSVGLGPYLSVVIGDYEILKDLSKLDAFTPRPPMWQWFNQYFRFGNGIDSRGVLWSQSDEWKEQKRYSLRVLRDFGFGKSSMEGVIHEELQKLTESLDQKCGKSMNMRYTFNLSIVNGLWAICTGNQMAINDPKLIKMVKQIDRIMTITAEGKIFNGFPWLRHIAPKASGWDECVTMVNDLIAFIEATMKPYIASFSEDDQPQNYIQSFLQHMTASKNEGSFQGERGLQNLRSNLLDFLFAGSETTSTALNWSMLLMAKYGDIQTQVQQELDNICGRERLPSATDRPNLHYTEAVVNEILRFTTIAPLAVPHYTFTDIWTSDKKYHIPAGTTIFPNLHQVTHNPQVFKNPEEFNPDRFLDDENRFSKNDHNIVFGIGKRDCLGKSLAREQLFLFFTGLMQRYRVRSPLEDIKDLSLEPAPGFTLTPKPFEVILERR